MADMNVFSLATKRLLLQSMSAHWRNDIFEEFTEEITLFMYPRPPKMIEETDAFIEESLKKMREGKDILCVILEKTTKKFLGCAGLHDIDTKTPELGVWLKKEAHGNKYGLEAMTALKQWADMNLTYDHIIYPVDRDNVPSRKIPEALGGKVHHSYDKKNLSGHILHTVEYHIPHSRS